MQSLLGKMKAFFIAPHGAKMSAGAKEPELSAEAFHHHSFVIGSLFTYYNEMPEEQQLRFVKRVARFRQGKRFHFIGLESHEDMEILVSASAVQVTFGLENYELAHFRDIYVLADAYHMDSDDELYIGHVAPEGIYVSWKHFLYGYKINNDNVNVAVHEMAHALLYNNFFAQYGVDAHFRLNYEKFSSSTGPILANVITQRKSYLRNYAFSNLHEFWAVSVEAFFENPGGLKENMPELYDAICGVLNQDPLQPDKRLISEP